MLAPARPKEQVMTLTLYYHPLASFCWKALSALYETYLDLSQPEQRAGSARCGLSYLGSS
jgi:hypothetical protein